MTPPGTSLRGVRDSATVLLFSSIFPAFISFISFMDFGPFSLSEMQKSLDEDDGYL